MKHSIKYKRSGASIRQEEQEYWAKVRKTRFTISGAKKFWTGTHQESKGGHFNTEHYLKIQQYLASL